jgi:FKBP-type peptidyl-prolyl cis-trans isomerase (trigger factor)
LDTEENNNLVPGFLSSLIGIHPGEARSFPIQFPESFDQESLRGVCAQFTVSVMLLKSTLKISANHAITPALQDQLVSAEDLVPQF